MQCFGFVWHCLCCFCFLFVWFCYLQKSGELRLAHRFHLFVWYYFLNFQNFDPNLTPGPAIYYQNTLTNQEIPTSMYKNTYFANLNILKSIFKNGKPGAPTILKTVCRVQHNWCQRPFWIKTEKCDFGILITLRNPEIIKTYVILLNQKYI